eukprot:TRINITY_DN4217_c0_g1_i1.p1 TRINITY_DN4217_c0_g1~~TRINITY_DN4217_c0_g1_i1.p1  ORF type:complete len:281 (+),score=46.96 TRINITY_DN4217_c0_g1_i1:130-972(+)
MQDLLNSLPERESLEAALDLMRRSPYTDVEKKLSNLIDVVPELSSELLYNVDQPLKIAHDTKAKKDYLLCDYNRDGESYRSPWSNQYFPPLKDGVSPSKLLRQLEIDVNDAFDVYRELYYEGGVSSVYFWDLDEEPDFGACILLKKSQDQTKRGQPMKGCWDSTHVLEVIHNDNNTAQYQLTSTVMLTVETKDNETGTVSLAGTITRQEERKVEVYAPHDHLVNIGITIEDMEFRLRNVIENIYFCKTKDIVNELRTSEGAAELKQKKNLPGRGLKVQKE